MYIQIGGIPLKCVIDTGSNVSTMTESFFRNHLKGGDEDINCTAKWLKLTAANKLPLPYLGYVELDIQVMGVTIPECGFLVVGDNDTNETDTSPPGIIAMNIVKRYRELGVREFDTALGEGLGSVWEKAFLRIQEAEPVGRMFVARAAGQRKVHVPAFSIATVYARGFRRQFDRNTTMLLEPGNTPLPSGLERDPFEVKFQRISTNNEEVTIRQKEGQESGSDPGGILD